MQYLIMVLVDASNQDSLSNIHLEWLELPVYPLLSDTAWLALHRFQFAPARFHQPHLNIDYTDQEVLDILRKQIDTVDMLRDIFANCVALI